MKNRGITLISLVITIVILLILAGISIQAITRDNGLFERAKEAKQAQIESEMKEKLILAIDELQIEKEGSATVNDIIQEWANEKLNEYNPKVRDANDGENQEKTITLTKSGVTKKYKIKEDLSIEEIDLSGIILEYEIGPKEGDKVNISIKISAEEGLKQIQTPEPDTINCNGKKEVGLDYKVEYGEEYIFTITTESGKEKQEKILILPEIEVSEATVNISNSTSVTTSAEENSIEKGTPLYINFNILTEGITYKIKYNNEEKTMPYEINKNGKYIFEVEGEYKGHILTKKVVEVIVKQYKGAVGVVAYDAGEWTREEIESLKASKLYDINVNHTGNNTYKLKEDSGQNFTFGGFTYKGDTENLDYINNSTIITSRNQSVSPQSGWGTPKYDGWQILESEERNNKKYVKKITHAGSPENFVYHPVNGNDNYRAEYLLSGGLRQTNYNKLSDNVTEVNARNWDMYKDKSKLDLIENVHAMDYSEARNANAIRATGAFYWISNAISWQVWMWVVYNDGGMENYSGSYDFYSFGIRPVVTMKEGVYIASGSGTEGDPYILAME